MTTPSQPKSQLKLPEPHHYGNEPIEFGFRVGNLFILDITPKMFTKNEFDITYFHQCLDSYLNVLKKKLSANSEDWMGLILCNVKKDLMADEYPPDDENDPEPKNVLTLQKFQPVEREMFMDIAKIRNGDIDPFKQLCTDDYSISEAFLHATRTYNRVKKIMASRKVYFLTCEDDPEPSDPQELNSIRINAKNFKDLAIRLHVIGLGDQWKYDLFFKEIEEISENLAARQFRRVDLNELEDNITHKSFVAANLHLRIQSLKIKVTIQAFSRPPRAMTKITASKATNEPLDKYTWWTFDDMFDDEDNDGEEVRFAQNPYDIKRAQNYGGRKILFTPEEVRGLRHVHEQGIDLLGFKPMPERGPMEQISNPYFLGCNSQASKGQIEFFAVLLSKMVEKKLMAVCCITTRKLAPPRLAYLMPYVEYGGFYLFRIPFKHEARDIDELTEKYFFDEENPAPINEEKLGLMKTLVKKLSVKYDVTMFQNPKSQRQQIVLENLALDLPPQELPADTTVPSVEDITDRLSQGNLYDRLQNVICSNVQIAPPAKVIRADDEYVKEVLEAGDFARLTNDKLKAVLRALNLSIQGKKQDFVNRLQEYKATKL
ncbi:X-ray repair cross-complementing protein 5-like [Cotesia glomerata]|uniref:SAP domain-containing protein n=1 Tax=Cotesia glomerata TaxID=32391 RepID=A0AAV7J0U4_COTGL|nr:X-ray repair cross-complementing protein 5-like [Cotesia glomerata]KAH0564343.1 hypothetical protein KQX54_011501 [Cotesia glomerata]